MSNEESEKQIDNKLGGDELNPKPWLWKKGQSGNLKGRPKGVTLKEYVKEYLAKMTDEERDEWLEGIDKREIWKMAEGQPHQTSDITSAGKPIPILGNVPSNDSHQEDTEVKQEN